MHQWYGWSAGRLLILDIGGGSMEIMLGRDAEPELAMSLPLGAGRLTRLFLPDDPPSRDQLTALRRHVNATLREVADRLLLEGFRNGPSALPRPSSNSPAFPVRLPSGRAPSCPGPSRPGPGGLDSSARHLPLGRYACRSPGRPGRGRERQYHRVRRADSTGTTIGALILAFLALYWRRLPLLRRGYEPGAGLTAPIQRFQSGVINDYVSWMVLGLAVIGGVLAVIIR